MNIQSKQQDYQNQSNQQYQQDTFPYNSKLNSIFKHLPSIEALTEYSITALIKKTPSYFHEYEKVFTEQIRNYGVGLIQECKNGTLLNLSDEAIEEVAENRIGDALDLNNFRYDVDSLLSFVQEIILSHLKDYLIISGSLL